MSDPNSNSVRREVDHPPVSVVQWMLGLVVWLMVPWWIILGVSPEGAMTFAVVLAFSLIGFGIATICVIRAVRTHRSRTSRREADAAGSDLRIHTGPLPLSQATAQLLLIPVAVAFGFTAIALVDVAVRVGS